MHHPVPVEANALYAATRASHLSFLRSVEQRLQQGDPRAACLLYGAVWDGRWRCFDCKTNNTVWQTAGSALASTCRACASPAWSCEGDRGDALELLAHDLRAAINAVSACTSVRAPGGE